jgi:hypothetical protein
MNTTPTTNLTSNPIPKKNEDNFMFGTNFTIHGSGLAGVTVTHPELTVLSSQGNEAQLHILETGAPGDVLEFTLVSPYGESQLISFKIADLTNAVSIQEQAQKVATEFSTSSQEQVCDISDTSVCTFWNF